MKERIEATTVYEFLTALGVQDVHTVRSVHIDPQEVTVHLSRNRLDEDGALVVGEHRLRIAYAAAKRASGGAMGSPSVPATVVIHDTTPPPAALARAVIAEIAADVRRGHSQLGRA